VNASRTRVHVVLGNEDTQGRDTELLCERRPVLIDEQDVSTILMTSALEKVLEGRQVVMRVLRLAHWRAMFLVAGVEDARAFRGRKGDCPQSRLGRPAVLQSGRFVLACRAATAY
jgi:hypothetical protein